MSRAVITRMVEEVVLWLHGGREGDAPDVPLWAALMISDVSADA